MTIEEIAIRIRSSYGVHRLPAAANRETCKELFYAIADAMLDWKHVKYDRASMDVYVDELIDWALCCEGAKYELTKGVLYKGSTGKGKTFLLQVFQQWLKYVPVKYDVNGKEYRMELEIANARTIAAEYAAQEGGGTAVILKYSQIPCLLIDDIGAESKEQNSYGNRVNVINDILDKRQERNLITFGTTNFDKLTAEAGYDDRLRRRILALFNIVPVKHSRNY